MDIPEIAFREKQNCIHESKNHSGDLGLGRFFFEGFFSEFENPFNGRTTEFCYRGESQLRFSPNATSRLATHHPIRGPLFFFQTEFDA